MAADPPRRRVYARAPGVLWRRVVDEILVLAPGADNPASLSAAAAVLWEELGSPASLPELAGSIARVLQRDPRSLSADLKRTLDELVRVDLVVVKDPVEFVDA